MSQSHMMKSSYAMKSRWTEHLTRSALAGVVGLAVLASGSVAQAQDDDSSSSSIWNFDRQVFRGIARGLGLQSGADPTIDYRERSPLVVPPSRNLPPPESGSTDKIPAWPVDPDATRRSAAAAKRKDPSTRNYDPDVEERSLRPSELNGPATAASRQAAAKQARPGSGNANPDGENESPSQLGFKGGLFSWTGLGFGGQKKDEDVGSFTSEPARSSLTAPPPGYQTPSASQPYGAARRIDRTVKPLDPAVGSEAQ
jgi:hypothetical protein